MQINMSEKERLISTLVLSGHWKLFFSFSVSIFSFFFFFSVSIFSICHKYILLCIQKNTVFF